jgi:hypothetical protein
VLQAVFSAAGFDSPAAFSCALMFVLSACGVGVVPACLDLFSIFQE